MRRILFAVATFAAAVHSTGAAAQTWIERPNAEEIAAAYPSWALGFGVEGRVEISCSIRPDGTLADCQIIEETPPGWSFGAASLGLTQFFRMSPAVVSRDNLRTVRIPIRFAIAGD